MPRQSGWPAKGRYSPRKGANRLPEKQRQRILGRYPNCQLAIPGVCTGRSVEVHHRVDAADGGPDDDHNLTGTCRECHRYLSARRSAQRAAGARGGRHLREPERHPGVLP
jgi:5-methylcytosine-specific restriction enzyme A